MKKLYLSNFHLNAGLFMGLLFAAFFTGMPQTPLKANDCTITNLQGSIAAGTLTFFNTAGRAMYTLVDPAGSNAPGDPGCFVSDAFPFTITNVQLNIGDATLFAQQDPGGVLEYKVQILHAANPGDTCTILDSLIYESPVQTLTVTTGAGFNPMTIPIGLDVTGAFYVGIEAVSWSGLPNRTPSIVLWTNQGIPACRQYVKTFNTAGDPVIVDFSNFYTAPGWTNLVVNGTTPPPTGTVDISVTDMTGGPDYYFGVPTQISASINNLGTADVGNIQVSLSENGTELSTATIALIAGSSQVVNFNYTPSATGDFTLMIYAGAANDIDSANNMASLEITVMPPPSSCIFEDDIESYNLGGLVAQSPQWVTWTPGAANQDAEVTNEQANSGTQSVKIGAAPQDVNFLLGNQTTGTWKIGFWLFVPTANAGYWNIQKSQTSGVAWAMQMFLNQNGTGSVDAGGANAATFTYPKNQWIEIEMIVNLDNNLADLYLDGNHIIDWPYSWSATSTAPGLMQIGSINFYPAAVPSPLMYIDDVSFCLLYNNSPCEAFELQLGVVVEGDNSNATPFDPSMAADATCWVEPTATIHNDVWYKFVVPEDGDYIVTTDLDVLTNDDTQLLIYASDDGTCEGNFTVVGCNDDVSASNYLSTVLLSDLTAGTVLFIMVDGWMGSSGTFQIGVFSTQIEAPDNNECADAANLSSLMGGPFNIPQNSGVFHNVNASGHTPTPDCFDDNLASVSTWYTFVGDGNTYFIQTLECSGVTDYAEDTQMAIYTGSCGALTQVACNEDIDFGAGIWEAGLSFQTAPGTTYYMLIDTWGGDQGEFCISFTNETEVSTNTPELVALQLFPNPVKDLLHIKTTESIESIDVFSQIGQLVISRQFTNTFETNLDMQNLPNGIYTVRINAGNKLITRKIAKLN